MPRRLHPTDAHAYWMSAVIPNDQFLLYCFDTDATTSEIRARLQHNASGIDELRIRLDDALGYPRVRTARVDVGRIAHRSTGDEWNRCLDRIAGLFSSQLNAHEHGWQMHVFESVTDAPRCAGPALVVVLQISHALGDGRVASSLARRLFGDTREMPVTAVDRTRVRPRDFLSRARDAKRLTAELDADVRAGRVPAQAPGRPRTRVNVAPTGPTSVRAVVRDRVDFTAAGTSVTVGALTAVSLALARYLTVHGDDVPMDLGAELTFAGSGERRARNHFRNAGVGLHPETVDIVERSRRIAADIERRRARGAHPATTAQALATEMVPAFLLRWGIARFDATAVPEQVIGNTVVSSVARGDGELHLGGGPVRFTAGFPALSPVMGLTHGIHGIGETVTLGVTSADSAVPDPDVYESLLRSACDEVAASLGR